MNIPQLPQGMMNRYADGTPSKAAASFPPNLAEKLSPEVAKKMLLWLSSNYIWPQIQERMAFEPMWQKMLEMVRVQLPTEKMFGPGDDATRPKQNSVAAGRNKARVADTVVHDAVQRLTDITCFIAFKEGLPAQYVRPEYIETPESTAEYQPLKAKIKAANALLKWNSNNHKLKRNSRLAYRHHYTYGIAYIHSDFKFKVEDIYRQDNQGQIVPNPEITEIGTTFTPLSLRKLWLNWRLPAHDMEMQPCPFYFDEVSRFAILQNPYDPVKNPFGYQNLDKLAAGQHLYGEAEMQSVQDALKATFTMMENAGISTASVSQILKPENSAEARWTLYPQMPFDPVSGEFEKMPDGTLIPYRRFVMEMFGPNVHSGSQTILRLQEMYYPKGKLPIYASAHMPDLDSGQYSPSIGQVLWNHFLEITRCTEQYFDNKDWINDPPSWVVVGSPAVNKDLNTPGQKIEVNGPNDFGWRQPYDATGSTVAMRQMLRDEAQTTSKAVDAILGKAMGSRTSATEASNAFQASMSAITTDIDMVSEDLHGEYAERTWDYSGLWLDPDLLKAITGQFGFEMSPQDMWLSIGIQTNVGSTYVEKIVRQQNTRYILEASRMEPGINRGALWSQLLLDMGHDPTDIVMDDGREQQIQLATVQACETYLGYPTLVDPDQNHEIAIKVKTAFIKDRNSNWNQKYGANAVLLIDQIQEHQRYVMLQQQLMLVQQQAQVAQAQLGIQQEEDTKMALKNRQQQTSPDASATQTGGEVAQQGAGAA